jgi:hypothetical protein
MSMGNDFSLFSLASPGVTFRKTLIPMIVFYSRRTFIVVMLSEAKHLRDPSLRGVYPEQSEGLRSG